MPTGAIADVRGRSGPLWSSIGLLSDPTAVTRIVISVASMSYALSGNRSAHSSQQQKYSRTSIDPGTVGALRICIRKDDTTRLMDAVWRLQTVTPFRRATVYVLIFFSKIEGPDCSCLPDCPIPHTRVRERTRSLRCTAPDTSFLLCCQCATARECGMGLAVLAVYV